MVSSFPLSAARSFGPVALCALLMLSASDAHACEDALAARLGVELQAATQVMQAVAQDATSPPGARRTAAEDVLDVLDRLGASGCVDADSTADVAFIRAESLFVLVSAFDDAGEREMAQWHGLRLRAWLQEHPDASIDRGLQALEQRWASGSPTALPPERPSSLAPWVLTGAGALTAVAGGVLLGESVRAGNDARDLLAARGAEGNVADYEAARSRAQALESSGAVLAAAGATAAVSGLVWWWIQGRRADEAPGVALTPWVQGVGLTLGGPL
jgi:hypothetical protein